MTGLDSHLQPDEMKHPDDDNISQMTSMLTQLTGRVGTLEQQNEQLVAAVRELQKTVKSM
jgi:hypothetical protein